jgi:hypothetical protein
MPWKKLLAWATGKIDEALRQKLEFVLEETVITAPCLTGIHLTGASTMPSARCSNGIAA